MPSSRIAFTSLDQAACYWGAATPAEFCKFVNFDPDPWQLDVIGSRKNTLMLCSRQVGKTTVDSIVAVMRAMGGAARPILILAPSKRQSNEVLARCADLVASFPWGERLAKQTESHLRFMNRSRIIALPGVARNIRVYSSVDTLISDEDAIVPDDVYRTFRPMLAVSRGRILLSTTPLGKRGHFYNEWVGNGDDSWERVTIRAEECRRIPPGFLASERKALGELWFKQEYECEFLDVTSSIFGVPRVAEVEPLRIDMAA